MLYFSKLKLVVIYFTIIFLTFASLINFIQDKDNYFLSKKVNLGLDLQGGSYLLLEVDSYPVIKQKLQNKLISLRKILKDKKIKYENLNLENNVIKFKLPINELKIFEDFFLNKNNILNTYFDRYKSYEMNLVIDGDLLSIDYTKYGLIEIKSSTLSI